MDKKKIFLAGLAILIAGCTASSAPAVASPVPQEMPEDTPPTAAPAVELPPTWTATITPTHTLTPTVTDTPTETPVVTSEPTEEKTGIPQALTTPGVNLASIQLLPSDLPRGYEELELDDVFGELFPLMEEQGSQVISMSVFATEDQMNSVTSMVLLVPTTKEADEFDKQIEDVPDQLQELMDIPSDSGVDFDLEMIEGFGPVGNTSIAVRMVMGFEGEYFGYEFAMFRRGPVAVQLTVIEMTDEDTGVDLEELALVMDERIIDAFEGSD